MTLLTPPRLRNSVRIVGAAVTALALLSACGGGGDSGGSASDSGGGDNTAAGSVDKYIGTWKGNVCHEHHPNPVLAVSTDQGKTYTKTHWRRSLAIEKTNPTEASVKVTYEFYQPTDNPMCSGKVIYTIKKIGVDPQNPNQSGNKKGESPSEGIWFGGVNKLVYKGNQTVGGSVVDRLEYTETSLGKLLSGFSAGGGIRLPVGEDPLLKMTLLPSNDPGHADAKTIAKVDGNTLTWAQFLEPGAGYPAEFSVPPETFTKQ